MIFRVRSALRLAAAALVAGLAALASVASAQEAMQLDLAFRNSLLRGSASQEQGEESHLQGRHRDGREAQGYVSAPRRQPRRHQ
jgi:hypothetical protein